MLAAPAPTKFLVVDKLGHEILMEQHMYLLNSFTGVL